MNWDLQMTIACEKGDIETVRECISNNATDFTNGLVYACLGGHKEIVELMIQNRANDYNHGLALACYKGYKDIVELMISKGATAWNNGLYNANYGNHKELILFMIIKGADIDNNILKLNFEDIYYLLQSGIKDFGLFNNIALECKKWKLEFKNTVNELFIKDVVNLLIEF